MRGKAREGTGRRRDCLMRRLKGCPPGTSGRGRPHRRLRDRQRPPPALWQRPLPSASVSQVMWDRVACNRGRAGPGGGHGGAGPGLAAPPAGASGREPVLPPGVLSPLHGPDAHPGLPDPGGDSRAGGWPWASLGHFPLDVGQVMTRVLPALSRQPSSQGNPWVPSRCVPSAVCRAGTGEAGG